MSDIENDTDQYLESHCRTLLVSTVKCVAILPNKQVFVASTSNSTGHIYIAPHTITMQTKWCFFLILSKSTATRAKKRYKWQSIENPTRLPSEMLFEVPTEIADVIDYLPEVRLVLQRKDRIRKIRLPHN